MNTRSTFHTQRSRLALLGLTVMTLALAACTADPVIPPEVTPPPTTTPPPVTPPGVTPPTTTPNPDIALVPYVYDGKDHSWSDTPPTTLGAARAAITVKPGTNDLSALTYMSAKNGWGPIETNTSNGDLAAKDGNPIKIDGKLYTTGIGAHAASEIIYNLNAQCAGFQTDVGVAAEVKSLGSVTFEIWVDGAKVFNTPVMTGATPHLSASVDLKGKQSLKLIVTDGGDGLNFDHADWAGAVLTGCTPTPTAPVYSGRLEITKGGTYSGNWESLDATKPAVEIKTSEPVTIENSNIRGKGNLISGPNAQLTVRNVNAYGLNPNVVGESVGLFANLSQVKSFTLENSSIEGTSGIYIYQKNASGYSGIKILRNKFLNIDGRQSDGKDGFTTVRTTKIVPHAVIFNHVHEAQNVEIAWNQIVNEAGKSYVEDNIDMYVSSGTPSSPILIHDNYIQGAYNANPWQNVYYYGGGIILGDGSTLSKDKNGNIVSALPAAYSGYANVYNNQIVNAAGYGLEIWGGIYNQMYDNRITYSGVLPDGRRIVGLIDINSGTWRATLGGAPCDCDGQHVANPPAFDHNLLSNNYLNARTVRDDGSFADNSAWSGDCGRFNTTCANNGHGKNSLATPEMEKQEYQNWLAKLTTNNVKVGNTR